MTTRNSQLATRGFTLTELLVVITIIAILASLITAGAMNAMRRGREASITLEIEQLSSAIERFKTEKGGAYPPNIYPNEIASFGMTNNEKLLNTQNVVRFLRKAAPRSTELDADVSPPLARNSSPNNGVDNVFPLTAEGIRPSEALVLWLSGFSSDQTRPLSGTDLEVTSIHDEESDTDINDVITIDAFDSPLFEFDKARLKISRNDDGSPRSLLVYNQGGTDSAQLLLYEYFPKGSEKPYVYFNTVDSPEMVVRSWETDEFYYQDPQDNMQVMVPLKQLKKDAPTTGTPSVANLEYVNQGKFQIFHPGVDDAWGNFAPTDGTATAQLDVQDSTFIPQLLYPVGPFTGDLADTLTNFTTGTLESEQE